MNFLRELRVKNQERQRLWPGNENIDVLFRAVEFSGESGELMNAVKKIYRLENEVAGNTAQRQELRQNLLDEIGDVLITLDNLAAEYDIDIEEVTKLKFNKTSHKVGISVFFD